MTAEPELPWVEGNPGQIQQVFLNLISNALKFTESGCVILQVAPHPRNASRIRFAVVDTGVGIPAAKLGIVGLSKSIALDMARFNVRSNCVSPFAWSRLIGTIPVNTPEEKARDFDYYEALTVRDSSLSACTQAVVAAEASEIRRTSDPETSTNRVR